MNDVLHKSEVLMIGYSTAYILQRIVKLSIQSL